MKIVSGTYGRPLGQLEGEQQLPLQIRWEGLCLIWSVPYFDGGRSWVICWLQVACPSSDISWDGAGCVLVEKDRRAQAIVPLSESDEKVTSFSVEDGSSPISASAGGADLMLCLDPPYARKANRSRYWNLGWTCSLARRKRSWSSVRQKQSSGTCLREIINSQNLEKKEKVRN